MNTVKKLAAALVMAAALYVIMTGGIYTPLGKAVTEKLGDRRMRNVTVIETSVPAASVTLNEIHPPMPSPVTAEEEPEAAVPAAAITPHPFFYRDPELTEDVQETTILGGLSIKNDTEYWIDAPKILAQGAGITLSPDTPQILIIHTHSSEAYTQAGLDRYSPSDTNRTEDTEFNIVRIGDELTAIMQDAGLNVIHDRGIYDYPSYTGSYTRSGEAVERYLEDYPSIRIVLDIHRDALAADGIVYKTMAEEDGVVASQVMLLVGSDESGLEHPNWRGNLALALYLQNAVNSVNPTLMRPVSLVRERYNQHLAPGSLIVEVGSNGNTLQEALAAIRLFGKAVSPALLELVE